MKASTTFPAAVRALFEKGCQCLSQKNYDRAIQFFSAALVSFPNCVTLLFNRGRAWYFKGNFHQALSDYSEAIKLQPDSARVYNNRGLCYQALKEYQKAIDDFSKAIELQPDFAGAYYNRASTYATVGDYERAWEDLKKAKALNYSVNPFFWQSVLKKKFQGQVDFVSDKIHSFQLREGHLPSSLQQLIFRGYLSFLPELPPGLKFVYDPITGRVSLQEEHR